MATYTIIGGDQKEYGPVSEGDIRQWIGESRLSVESLVKSDADAAWRTLGSFPEFAPLFAAGAPAPIAPPYAPARPGDGNFLERDYELDIGGCVTRGWEVFKTNLGPLFACSLIVEIIAMVFGGGSNALLTLVLPRSWFASEIFHQGFNLFSTALVAVVVGPLMGGLYHVFLQAGRGRPVEVGEVFLGFQKNFKQLFLGYLAVALLVGVCLIPYNVVNDLKVLPLVEQMQHTPPTEVQNLLPQIGSAFVATLPILLLCLIPVTYLSVNLQFTLPLIVDKEMEFLPAMKASWKMVHKHWWHVFGLTVVVGLVSVAGILGCCIGIIFTLPIGIATMLTAYETIFAAGKK